MSRPGIYPGLSVKIDWTFNLWFLAWQSIGYTHNISIPTETCHRGFIPNIASTSSCTRIKYLDSVWGHFCGSKRDRTFQTILLIDSKLVDRTSTLSFSSENRTGIYISNHEWMNMEWKIERKLRPMAWEYSIWFLAWFYSAQKLSDMHDIQHNKHQSGVFTSRENKLSFSRRVVVFPMDGLLWHARRHGTPWPDHGISMILHGTKWAPTNCHGASQGSATGVPLTSPRQ